MLRELSRVGNSPYGTITGKREPFLSSGAYATQQVRGSHDASIERTARESISQARQRLRTLRVGKGASRSSNAERNLFIKKEGTTAPRRGSTGAAEIINTLRREAQRRKKERKARGDIWPDGWPRLGK